MVCQECCHCRYKTFNRLTLSHLSAGCQVRDLKSRPFQQQEMSLSVDVCCQSQNQVVVKAKKLSWHFFCAS